jgi:hypothetical protein
MKNRKHTLSNFTVLYVHTYVHFFIQSTIFFPYVYFLQYECFFLNFKYLFYNLYLNIPYCLINVGSVLGGERVGEREDHAL